MGNDSTCSRLCQKSTVIESKHDDILTTEYIVPCQICNTQFKHQALKQHIDLKHYATIKEANENVVVECLLCSKVFSDLIEHGKHLSEKHPYVENIVSSGRSRGKSEIVAENIKSTSNMVGDQELNKTKKSIAVKLEHQQNFQIIKQIEENHYEASVYGLKYDVLTFVKDYRGADYDQEVVQAELVWYNIFKQAAKCRYYYLDLQPGQRNILCKAYLFMMNSN